MYVTKRDGQTEIVSFDKILRRIKTIGHEAGIKINYTTLAMKVIDQLYDNISTTKIDELTADQCASMSSIHYDYGTLASHITISNHHKNTESSFLMVMSQLYNYLDKHDKHSPLITRELLDTADANIELIEQRMDFKRDYVFDYFGFKTLEHSYLMRINGKVVERPQHMWMRVSLGIHGTDIHNVLQTYDLMSKKYFTHATPTLFNSGTPRPQMSSCFLIAMENDSIDGIYNTLKDCALISKWAGGIGLHIHNVRATNSHIRGTNGTSNGIVPMLKVFNNTAKYVDQCLDPETIVYTKRGPIKIKNIIIGDEVVTDDGNFYTIRKVLDYPEYKGDIYELDVKHSLYPLKMTDMHPLWVVKNDKFVQTNFNYIISDLERKLVVPDFIEAKHVKENDFVGFPIPKWEQDIACFTEEDCRMYGILIGDGNLSATKNLCYVSLNSETKKDTIEFVEAYLLMLGIHITYSENHKNIRLVFSRNNMFKFTYEMLYDENKEKKILPNMLHLPVNKTLNIIKGILETDANISNLQIALEMTSANIIESVRYMLLRLGILSSGRLINRCGQTHVTVHGSTITHKKPSMVLLIPKTEIICNLFPNKGLKVAKGFKFFEYNGYLFSIVKSNKKTENYEGRVIDIEVDNENHHNFVTHSGLVKNGGGKRNGSFAIYLEPWHADIEKFLEMRKNHGDEELKARDLFYALWIPDLFMNRIKSDGTWTLMCPDECPGLSDVYGEEFEQLYTSYETAGKGRVTVKARDLWFKVLDAQMETGTPYLCYKDSVNRKSNQKNIGIIKSSNLCVAPETLILTDKGHIQIDSLENQKVNVWNGEEYSEVEVKKTGENQSLIEVHTDDGSVLTCTPYHKFYIQTSFAKSKIIQTEAQNLKEDDKIIKCAYPIIDGPNEMSYSYICGGGTAGMPANDNTLKNKLEWFSGYCDACGTIEKNHLQVSSTNKDFLLKVKLMLQTCGINPDFNENENETKELLITSIDLRILVNAGFSPNRLIINTENIIQRSASKFTKIKKIVNNNRIDNTFCFAEPKRHMGIFNGILTGQCAEIAEVSTPEETAVCNLASIGLPTFIEKDTSDNAFFNYERLREVSRVITDNLNKVIDVNYYPTDKTRVSNMRHRPIGIGIQGLADVFMLLDIPFYSDEAREVNRRIFETIYYGALEKSAELALYHGPYETYAGSPASQGILQFDMWNTSPSDNLDWIGLKAKIATSGLRNSLLVAPMPTASTSQILGFNECFEPFTSNIYSRRTLAGEFVLTNKYLMRELIELGLWNTELKNNIIANQGSVQHIDNIPEKLKLKYKTVWEIPMRHIIDMAAERGAFVCQSQSLNLWQEDPNYNSLTSMHFYAWSKGLKTGMYYLRRRGKHRAQQFTIEPKKNEDCIACSA
jgi:ribonucleoside-diphosphate reductase alpha chain